MNRKRIYLICVAVVIVSALYATITRAQEPSEADSVRPQMKEGRMFAVTLTPAGRKLDISVVGKEVARIDFAQLGIVAQFKVGKRVLQISPQRRGNVFWLETPEESNSDELDLRLNYKRRAETFKFKLNQARP